MPSFQSFQEFSHQKLFFDLKDKNYQKAKMKGGLGWMGMTPSRFLMGTIFLVTMNKLQELTVFHGRQKLTSAKN